MSWLKNIVAEYRKGKTQYARYGIFVLSYRIVMRLFKPVVQFYSERIYQRDLAGEMNMPAESPPGIEMKCLTPDQFIKQEDLRQYVDRDRIQKRFDENHTCFLALADNKIAFYAWGVLGERTVFDEVTIWPLRIEANEVYLTDCFTVEDFRGRGIFPYMLKEIARYYKTQNADCIKAIVYGRNYASWRSFQKGGYELSQVIRYVKLFFLPKPIYFVKHNQT